MMVAMKTNLIGYLAAIEGPVVWLTPIAVERDDDDLIALATVTADVLRERGWAPQTNVTIKGERVQVACGSLPIATRVREALAGERSFSARVRRRFAS